MSEAEVAKGYTKAELAEGKRICELSEDAPRPARPLTASDQDYKRLMKLMPAPPPAWRLKTEKVEAFFNHAIGCGIAADRIYESGRGEIVLTIQLIPALGHPDIARNFQKLATGEKIAGRSVLWNSREGLGLMIGWMTIMASGSAPDADRRAIFERIDFDAVEKERIAR